VVSDSLNKFALTPIRYCNRLVRRQTGAPTIKKTKQSKMLRLLTPTHPPPGLKCKSLLPLETNRDAPSSNWGLALGAPVGSGKMFHETQADLNPLIRRDEPSFGPPLEPPLPRPLFLPARFAPPCLPARLPRLFKRSRAGGREGAGIPTSSFGAGWASPLAPLVES
jgi:hypothetical protein